MLITPRSARLRAFAGAAALLPLLSLLGACDQAEAGPKLGLDEPLPTSVPKKTSIVVGDPQTQVALELSGEIDKFTYPVKFANIAWRSCSSTRG